MATSLPARRPAPAVPTITRDYVAHLLVKLVEAEADLVAMNDKYAEAKSRFDRSCARRGITPESDIIGYIDIKSINPELQFWYSKVEHYQRQVAAYGTSLTGLEAACRILGADRSRAAANNRRARDGRPGLYRAS